MATLTLRVTGLSEETLRKIDEQAKRNGRDRNGFLRDLIEGAVTANRQDDAPSILDLFAPVQEEFRQSGMTEADLDVLIEEARNQVHRNPGITRIG